MADISITAADVAFIDTDGTRTYGQAGEAATQGEACYRHTDGKYYKADANDTAAKAAAVGVWMNKVATGEYGYIARVGCRVRIGGTMTAAADYYVSPNVGKLCPLADLTTGHYKKKIGAAESTAILVIDPSHAIPTV